jgi:hypothetical protein
MTPLLIAAEKRGHAIHFGIHMLNSQLDLMMQFFGLDGSDARYANVPVTLNPADAR